MESFSRKRTSDTEIIHRTNNDTMMMDSKNIATKSMSTDIATKNNTNNNSSRLRVRVKRFHAVAKWTWNAGSEDEVCGICQSAFEGVAPGIKYPGDECPVVFGKCGHAFHLQCVATWLNNNSSRQTCPICRAEWEYGQSTDAQRRGRGSSESN